MRVSIVIRTCFWKVEVTNDCAHVSPGQHFEMKVKTVPSYCGVVWTSTYVVPGKSTHTFASTTLQLKVNHLFGLKAAINVISLHNWG